MRRLAVLSPLVAGTCAVGAEWIAVPADIPNRVTVVDAGTGEPITIHP